MSLETHIGFLETYFWKLDELSQRGSANSQSLHNLGF